ncbi:signal recognition particle-docking protein FtsY [Pseudomonas sp.]|uniref:signal recognition particle-docking protein FtsY n=1 Tax=Pseudomonas sp. TaxID=306 RepID=UPI003A976788
MFGSKDDKNPPAEAGTQAQPVNEEKKSLFGWWRKKPAETAAEPAQPAPVEQPASARLPAELSTPEPAPAPEALPAAEPEVVGGAPAPQPEPLVAEPPAATPVVAEQPPVVPEPVVEALPEVVAPATVAAPVTQEKPSFFARLKQGLSKTSASLGEGMASLFLGKKAIDDDLLDDLETRLLTADVGVEATTAIIGNLTKRVARKELADSGALYKALQEELVSLLKPVEQPLLIDGAKQPYVILVVGVNGVGKTTTIGKLAKKLQLEGKKVMLAAGDTFRAAAVEQLQVWGERNNIAVIAQHTGADSASVIFDAVQAAKSRGIDVLIADTAGRLHTKDNLMEELKKVRRVIGKLDETAPHEVLLVLDAGTGQNAINQAKQFNQTVNLTGLALTKLDGTAKGGVIFALAKQFGLPIRYIGVGEGIDDLRPFQAQAFVQALFEERERG